MAGSTPFGFLRKSRARAMGSSPPAGRDSPATVIPAQSEDDIVTVAVSMLDMNDDQKASVWPFEEARTVITRLKQGELNGCHRDHGLHNRVVDRARWRSGAHEAELSFAN